MMKITTIASCICMGFLFMGLLTASQAQARAPMRIIAVESGPYIEYYHMLHGIAVRLQEEGLFKKVPPYEPKRNGAAILWKWMSENSGSHFVFLKDGFYSGQWDTEKQNAIYKSIVNRLNIEHSTG